MFWWKNRGVGKYILNPVRKYGCTPFKYAFECFCRTTSRCYVNIVLSIHVVVMSVNFSFIHYFLMSIAQGDEYVYVRIVELRTSSTAYLFFKILNETKNVMVLQ